MLLLTGHATSKKVYKACKPLYSNNRSNMDFLSQIPCGVCPLINNCSDHGIISPISCQYYSQWLNHIDNFGSTQNIEAKFQW